MEVFQFGSCWCVLDENKKTIASFAHEHDAYLFEKIKKLHVDLPAIYREILKKGAPQA